MLLMHALNPAPNSPAPLSQRVGGEREGEKARPEPGEFTPLRGAKEGARVKCPSEARIEAPSAPLPDPHFRAEIGAGRGTDRF